MTEPPVTRHELENERNNQQPGFSQKVPRAGKPLAAVVNAAARR
jgi:hypothetical protein